MARGIQVSTRIDAALAADLDTILATTHPSATRSQLLYDALKQYIARERQYIDAVQRGQEDIRAGRFITDEEMEASLDRIEAELSARQ